MNGGLIKSGTSPCDTIVASPLMGERDVLCLSICKPRLCLGSAVHAPKGIARIPALKYCWGSSKGSVKDKLANDIVSELWTDIVSTYGPSVTNLFETTVMRAALMTIPVATEITTTFAVLNTCTVGMLILQCFFHLSITAFTSFPEIAQQNPLHLTTQSFIMITFANLSTDGMSHAISIVRLVMIPMEIPATNLLTLPLAFDCGMKHASKNPLCSFFGFLCSRLGSRSVPAGSGRRSDRGARSGTRPPRGAGTCSARRSCSKSVSLPTQPAGCTPSRGCPCSTAEMPSTSNCCSGSRQGEAQDPGHQQLAT